MRKLYGIVLCALGMAGPAWGLTQVNSAAELGGNTTTDWASLAPSGGTLSQPVQFTTSTGVTVTVTAENPLSQITIQPNPTFSRDFLPGQVQLFSTNNDTLTLSFSHPILGVGTQVTHPHQGAYLTVLTAYDASNNVIGTFQGTAFENNSGDGSALYIGATDATPLISRITLQNYEGTQIESEPSNQDTVLITNLNLLTGASDGEGGGGTPGVPEPASLALLGVGAAGLMMRRRR